MPVKIRLARHGRKKFAFYHVVVADSRAPRDGKFIERIGLYNPNTNPATVELDFDKALSWLFNGAQPTDTARAILSYKGVLMKKHLLEGVKKGAFDEAEAEKRFATWKQGKEAKILSKIEKLASESQSEFAQRLVAEAKVNEARAAELAKRNSELAAEVKKAEAAEAATEEVVVEVPAEVAIEEVAVEAPAEVANEEVVAEAPEATAEVVSEEVVAEAPAAEEETKEAEA